MRIATLIFVFVLSSSCFAEGAKRVQTPYEEQKVVFDFYFDDPNRINSALFWIRSLMNPLSEEPYNISPDFLDIVVIIHGTEIVTVAKHNYKEYKDAVERMKYYAELGVSFRVCGLAAADYSPDGLVEAGKRALEIGSPMGVTVKTLEATIRVQEKAKGTSAARAIMKDLENVTAEVRRAMTQKYNVEFK